MNFSECGYGVAKRATKPGKVSELCTTYQTFLRDMIEFCLDWCLFDGANFGRRSIGKQHSILKHDIDNNVINHHPFPLSLSLSLFFLLRLNYTAYGYWNMAKVSAQRSDNLY